ncbi:hypothetical protein FRX31_027373 [Thalictrum thalictroides]|uniref:Uncharacterized protein n=1 Tax=Thalictrum thalictroides TaxID=46969 RepID=A0A7J6VD61_THATH|nr:hypothetical protein FRX31_027373 [Thalictrum thalictroides]
MSLYSAMGTGAGAGTDKDTESGTGPAPFFGLPTGLPVETLLGFGGPPPPILRGLPRGLLITGGTTTSPETIPNTEITVGNWMFFLGLPLPFFSPLLDTGPTTTLSGPEVILGFEILGGRPRPLLTSPAPTALMGLGFITLGGRPRPLFPTGLPDVGSGIVVTTVVLLDLGGRPRPLFSVTAEAPEAEVTGADLGSL